MHLAREDAHALDQEARGQRRHDDVLAALAVELEEREGRAAAAAAAARAPRGADERVERRGGHALLEVGKPFSAPSSSELPASIAEPPDVSNSFVTNATVAFSPRAGESAPRIGATRASGRPFAQRLYTRNT